MVEQGLVMYVQAGLAALTPPVVVPGGFFVQLEKDLISWQQKQAWSYRTIGDDPSFVLNGQAGWTEWHVQIDCHGFEGADAIKLAAAIRKVLRPGFTGTLPDPDQTVVFGLYRLPGTVDGYSDANRSFVRSMEFVVQYNQT